MGSVIHEEIFFRIFAVAMVEIDNYTENLTEFLLVVATGDGYLKGELLSSQDIDDAWMNYASAFYADAVHNFNDYPEFCLACAGYLGMAVAHLWDKDWLLYKDKPYSFFLGARGFDDMDDHITASILRETEHSVAAMESCSAAANHYLLKTGAEPGTAEAYRLFLKTTNVLYRIGAAIELCRLGYHLEKV